MAIKKTSPAVTSAQLAAVPEKTTLFKSAAPTTKEPKPVSPDLAVVLDEMAHTKMLAQKANGAFTVQAKNSAGEPVTAMVKFPMAGSLVVHFPQTDKQYRWHCVGPNGDYRLSMRNGAGVVLFTSTLVTVQDEAFGIAEQRVREACAHQHIDGDAAWLAFVLYREEWCRWRIQRLGKWIAQNPTYKISGYRNPRALAFYIMHVSQLPSPMLGQLAERVGCAVTKTATWVQLTAKTGHTWRFDNDKPYLQLTVSKSKLEQAEPGSAPTAKQDNTMIKLSDASLLGCVVKGSKTPYRLALIDGIIGSRLGVRVQLDANLNVIGAAFRVEAKNYTTLPQGLAEIVTNMGFNVKGDYASCHLDCDVLRAAMAYGAFCEGLAYGAATPSRLTFAQIVKYYMDAAKKAA